MPNATFLAELFAFGVLVFILAKYVIPPVNKAMTDRQDKIRAQFDEAAQLKSDAESTESELKAQLADARAEASRIREEAREQGAQIIAQHREQAQVEADRITSNAQAQIEVERVPGVVPAQGRGRFHRDHAGRAHRRGVPRRRRPSEALGRAVHRRAGVATPARRSRRADARSLGGFARESARRRRALHGHPGHGRRRAVLGRRCARLDAVRPAGPHRPGHRAGRPVRSGRRRARRQDRRRHARHRRRRRPEPLGLGPRPQRCRRDRRPGRARRRRRP